MTIYLHDESGFLPAGGALPAAVERVLATHGRADSDVTLALMRDEEVRALNFKFRGEDRVTDVLSFSAGEEQDGNYLGDVIIAYPYVRALSQEGDRPIEEWLLLLAVHGTLHLLGHTHEDKAAQEMMWHAQAEALSAYGIDESLIHAMLMTQRDLVSK